MIKFSGRKQRCYSAAARNRRSWFEGTFASTPCQRHRFKPVLVRRCYQTRGMSAQLRLR
jgi:hypothetical protein